MNKKLQLGAFSCPLDGWINTDISPHIYISRIPGLPRILHVVGILNELRLREHKLGLFRQLKYLDVRKRFPFPDNTFAAIFSAHMLEHIHPFQVPHMFQECLRVLKPNGVLRIAVPDLDCFVQQYSIDEPEKMLKGVFEHGSRANRDRHQWMYTGPSLCRVFCESGFTLVEQKRFREGACPDIEKLDNRRDRSIFVEGFKPEAHES